MRSFLIAALCGLAVCSAPACVSAFDFVDGDRVVLIGGTLVEREQQQGYIEAALTVAAGDAKVTFRNLGWSGDTVWSESRGIFDPAAKGYERLIEQVAGLKPTVLVLNYGLNESYAGPAGQERFLAQYHQLCDDLLKAAPQARLVFVTPLLLEHVGPPLPNPVAHNENIRHYAEAIRQFSADRNGEVVDLTAWSEGRLPGDELLTENGVHPTPEGYQQIAAGLLNESAAPEDIVLRVSPDGASVVEDGTAVARFESANDTVKVQLTTPLIPLIVRPMRLSIDLRGFSAGTYEVRVDDGPQNRIEVIADRAAPFHVKQHPGHRQAERLRHAIRRKNELYFHRWRPQNVTYLFGFRKHEQGQNAVEIPEFDPLIAAEEQNIQQLRTPAVTQIVIRKLSD